MRAISTVVEIGLSVVKRVFVPVMTDHARRGACDESMHGDA